MDSSRSRVLVLDESLRGNVIAVGGYVVTADRLGEIVETWRALKRETLGIDPTMELKYTMPDHHPTRRLLDGTSWNHSRRVPAMLDVIAGLDVRLLVDVLVDVRAEKRPEQWYLDGLGWCLRRQANEVDDDVDGPHWAIVDMPPQAGELDAAGVSERLREMHEHVGTAAFDHYQRLYLEPEDFGWGRVAQPLRAFGFAPTLVAAHARHCDLLQIADIVVGSASDFVSNCIRAVNAGMLIGSLPAEGWREENMRRIGPKFRRGPAQVCGYGFDVFPPHATGVAEVRERFEALCW